MRHKETPKSSHFHPLNNSVSSNSQLLSQKNTGVKDGIMSLYPSSYAEALTLTVTVNGDFFKEII